MSGEDVLLANVLWPVTTLGPGRRIGIWFQGCTLACPGCMSRHTWDERSGRRRRVPEVVDELLHVVPADEVDGITISGGEPFEQADALLTLLSSLRERFESADILVYSGLGAHELRCRFSSVLASCDAVVAGPYVGRRAQSEHWRGSANQELLVLSERANRAIVPWCAQALSPALQASTQGGTVTLVGIPARGQLSRMRAALQAKGLSVEPGWLP